MVMPSLYALYKGAGMLNSTSPTTLVFPVEDLGGLQLQGKALHGPLEEQPIFSKSAAARRGARCALLACKAPVELVSPSWSNKLVEDSAGRLRPTAAAPEQPDYFNCGIFPILLARCLHHGVRITRRWTREDLDEQRDLITLELLRASCCHSLHEYCMSAWVF